MVVPLGCWVVGGPRWLGTSVPVEHVFANNWQGAARSRVGIGRVVRVWRCAGVRVEHRSRVDALDARLSWEELFEGHRFHDGAASTMVARATRGVVAIPAVVASHLTARRW